MGCSNKKIMLLPLTMILLVTIVLGVSDFTMNDLTLTLPPTFNLSGLKNEPLWVVESANDGTFIGGDNGIFGYYKILTNSTIDLSETDEGDWIGTDLVLAIKYVASQQKAYLETIDGKVGYYDINQGRTYEITTELFGSAGAEGGIAYDRNSNRLWMLGHGTSNDPGQVRFGYINLTTNSTTDLSNRIVGNISIVDFSNGQDIGYNPNTNKLYMVGGGAGGTSNFIVYDVTGDTVSDLTGIAGGQIMALSIDTINNGVYLLNEGGNLWYYDVNNNTTTDLVPLLPIPIGTINGGQFEMWDNINDGAYFGGNPHSFMRYDKISNNFTDFTSFLPDDFTIYSLSFDSANNGVWIVGKSGIGIGSPRFGFFKIGNPVKADVLSTNNNSGKGIVNAPGLKKELPNSNFATGTSK